MDRELTLTTAPSLVPSVPSSLPDPGGLPRNAPSIGDAPAELLRLPGTSGDGVAAKATARGPAGPSWADPHAPGDLEGPSPNLHARAYAAQERVIPGSMNGTPAPAILEPKSSAGSPHDLADGSRMVNPSQDLRPSRALGQTLQASSPGRALELAPQKPEATFMSGLKEGDVFANHSPKGGTFGSPFWNLADRFANSSALHVIGGAVAGFALPKILGSDSFGGIKGALLGMGVAVAGAYLLRLFLENKKQAPPPPPPPPPKTIVKHDIVARDIVRRG